MTLDEICWALNSYTDVSNERRYNIFIFISGIALPREYEDMWPLAYKEQSKS